MMFDSALNGSQSAEQRRNIGDERADAIDDCPRDPDAAQPVPRLVHLMLIIGELCADDRDGGHQTGQHRADACDLVVNIYDDAICRRPHILDGKRLHTKQADAQQKQQAECIKTI